MDIFLLYKNRENHENKGYYNRMDMIKDLNMNIVFKSMAKDDSNIFTNVQSIMMNPLTDKQEVEYRQQIVKDAMENRNEFEMIYEIVSEAMEQIKKHREMQKKVTSSMSKTTIIFNSLEILYILVSSLEKLKDYIDQVDLKFSSEGMKNFCERLQKEYNVEFVDEIKNSLKNMTFLTKGGKIGFSATIGSGMKGSHFVVNSIKSYEYEKETKSKVLKFIINMYYRFFRKDVVLIDNSTLKQEAQEMETAGIHHVLKMYQDFIKELETFFEKLRFQISFYVGCENLGTRLNQVHLPITYPEVRTDKESTKLSIKGLYELSMAIYTRTKPVENDLEREEHWLYIITGANQGGKSTFLRSIGIAQVLMQCGMFVPADYYCNKIYRNIFTHFTRREDIAMNSGRLDEECRRMEQIIQEITKDSMLLLNESFATTTEKEGSLIAKDIITALYESEIQVFMVTHLFEFSKEMYAMNLEHAVFLSAERKDDGTRTFKMIEHEPSQTSYGLDLYEDIIENGVLVPNEA